MGQIAKQAVNSGLVDQAVTAGTKAVAGVKDSIKSNATNTVSKTKDPLLEMDLQMFGNKGSSAGSTGSNVEKASGAGGTNKNVVSTLPEDGNSTVGRWMSNDEYNKMIDTGKVQMSPNGNRTYVASPASKDAFPSAPNGSIYSEFDVAKNSLYPAGNENWSQIPGPGSLIDRLNQKKGLPAITEMPDALNIKNLGGK